MPNSILAFDPDPNFCFALQEVLRVYNYHVKVSSSGEDVHETILLYRPDILIFNPLMYQVDLNGFRVGLDKSLAALYLPMIIVADQSLISLQQWAGLHFYQAQILVKSLDVTELKVTIANALRLRFN